ncbi:MAG TPA: CsbD family protein [Thermomicrobiales bacterium]|nr:CsbD family protein [Thermomicrobiales bacterium]
MDSSDKNRIEGTFEEHRGKAKETLGDLRDDKQQETEGKSDQASGDLKQSLADVKDKVSDTIKKATS